MELTIDAKVRETGSKPNALRRAGRIPATLYGHQGASSVPITIDAKSASILLRDAVVNNTIVNLNVADQPWQGKTLIREVQTHAWKDLLYHISFFAVTAQDSVDVTVPIHLIGEPTGVKLQGGNLDAVLTEITIRCAPNAIPEAITVDVTGFQVGEALHIKELPLPAGAVALGEPDSVVFSILAGHGSTAEGAAADTAG